MPHGNQDKFKVVYGFIEFCQIGLQIDSGLIGFLKIKILTSLEENLTKFS